MPQSKSKDSPRSRHLRNLGFLLLGLAILAITGRLFGPTPEQREMARQLDVLRSEMDGVGFDLDGFLEATDRLLQESDELAEKVVDYDEARVLGSIPQSEFAQYRYRLDHHLNDASIHYQEPAADARSNPGRNLNIEFGENDAEGLAMRGGTLEIEGGIAIANFRKITNYLHTTGSLNLPREDIHGIEIRLRTNTVSPLELLWTDKKEKGRESISSRKASLYPQRDGKFHTYRISLRHSLGKDSFFRGDLLQRFFIAPLRRGSVEIDYLRILLKEDVYAEEKTGLTYEKIDNELRQAIYSRVPVELEYRPVLPEGKLRIRFGIGLLREEGPVKVAVVIEAQGRSEVCIERDYSSGDRWEEAEFDLPAWASGSAKLTFRVTGGSDQIVFISNPQISAAPRRRFNVILILEDALRADHLGAYGYHRDTSPNHDTLAREGALFRNAFAQAPITRPSCPSLMTGLYPSATGVWYEMDSLAPEYITLAEILSKQGFSTTAMIQNLGNAGPPAGLHQGYESVFDQFAIGSRPHQIISDELFRWLRSHKEDNFFLYLHLLDPHGEYAPPEEYREWYEEGNLRGEKIPPEVAGGLGMYLDPEWAEGLTVDGRIGLYDGEIAYNDLHLGRLMGKLAELGIYEDTLIVILSDHGDFMGEHGLWSHHPPGYRGVLNVPLIMRLPKQISGGQKIDRPVQLVDLLPTILDLLGLLTQQLPISGESLLPLMTDSGKVVPRKRLAVSEEYVFSDLSFDLEKFGAGSLFFENFHILNSNELKPGTAFSGMLELLRRPREIRLFDYPKDPDETHNLYSGTDDVFLKQLVQEALQKHRQAQRRVRASIQRGTSGVIEYDPEAFEQMNALGYLGGGVPTQSDKDYSEERE